MFIRVPKINAGGLNERQQLIDALNCYFDDARPDDDAHNAAISRAYRERYGGQFLLLAPAVIIEIEGLRNLVAWQTIWFHPCACSAMRT